MGVVLVGVSPVGTSPPPATSLDISVTAMGIISPTVTNDGGASDITDITAKLNGEITDNGNENPTVTVFYGLADGGVNPAAWSNNTSLGIHGLGVLSYDYNGLTPSIMYFYRMFAQNSGGSSWAVSTANFTTLGALPHQPTNFVLTKIDSNTVSATWTKGLYSFYTAIQLSNENYPVSYNSSTLAYYGTGTSCNFTWPIETNEIYASAWGVASDNITYSDKYAKATTGGKMILITLAFIALALMVSSYVFKRPGLAIAGGVVWLLFGIWSLTLSTATWDVNYDLFIVGVGMFIMGLFEAMELRPKTKTDITYESYWERSKKDYQSYEESQSGKPKLKKRQRKSEIDEDENEK